uniref:Uncharacterized protein n=1 Tax=Arundo donax TaxID=35708 RepID=A0A0A9BMS5_ARUDO
MEDRFSQLVILSEKEGRGTTERPTTFAFYYTELYDSKHAEKCTNRPKAQVNAFVVNDLDVVLTEGILNQLAVEDALAEEFCTLSLNAISGKDEGEAMKLRAMVKNKVMLILIDSGSSHSFVSTSFVNKVALQSISTTPKQVRVANGDTLLTN